MYKNFFLISFRNVLKNRLYSIITVVGLSVGICAFLLINMYVDFEKSYDQFHEKKHRIFRLRQDRYVQGQVSSSSVLSCAGAGPDIKNYFPSVTHYAKLLKVPAILTYNDDTYEESNFFMGSEDFFEIFSVPLLQGEDSAVLSRPNTIVLSESVAKKYFGDEDPIGKILDFRKKFDFEVTGVFKDLPPNSHMKVDLLASFKTYENYAGEHATSSWIWDNYYTYVLLAPGASAQDVEERLPVLVDLMTGEWLKEGKQDLKIYLQPLTDIHLESNLKHEMQANGNSQTVYYLQLISYFILIIAFINYVNVATVKSLERSKEVGVRKVLGSHRGQLVVQFLTESFMINGTAIVISFALAYLLTPSFAALAGREISAERLWSADFLKLAGLLIVSGTILSGLYPAIILSSFRPVQVLKGKFSKSNHGVLLRKGLVVVQFVASIALIVSTYVVYKQITFLQNQSIGFNLDQVLVVRGSLTKDSLYAQQLARFKNELEKIPGVSSMTTVSEVPGAPIQWSFYKVRRLSAPKEENNQFQVVAIDEDFLNVFGLSLAAGRMYQADDATNGESIMLNEKALALLGFNSAEAALDQAVIFGDDTLNVIGVVKNYHHETLKYSVSPVFYPYDPARSNFLPVRLSVSSIQSTLRQIESLYLSTFPGNPFNAYFLDDHYGKQYKSDIQFGKVVGLFSIVTVVITCLGLFGLSSYTVMLRTKEIGIRKVMGASGPHIMHLLTRDYTFLILFAMIVSIPVSYYFMSQWLENFANRISLDWWIFILPTIIVILLTWLTVSAQTLRAATSNPADTLRCE